MAGPTEQDKALAKLDEALRQLASVPPRVKALTHFRVIESRLARLIEMVEREEWD